METLPASPGFGHVLQMLAALVVVVGIILGASFVLKRFRLMPQGNGAIQVKAVRALGARSQLVLVEVAGEQILLGVTPGQITRLSAEQPAPSAFAQQLEGVR
ncbi:MAG: flagellar biosynthetic protein FliO [Polycyclovorans sp.]|jgi:flagellar protein FliO/FliZ|nr:flagellar biosynthetic protein FliO [Polycyclovorans sp.]MBU0789920.1 flagellar biosynthetic protein FliO [Gammaproteobacteria bacterium]MEC8848881.1 flagellar biosynthetic protein FliO [Pseudomonadota bacterium]|tara:strand:+ start:937 stop:1242 length:306 start_codon:yes stop_codon:yes gene_type:complete